MALIHYPLGQGTPIPKIVTSYRHPVYTYTRCWIICEKVRKKNHLETPQNNLGTPLGVPTPTLGTTGLIPDTSEQIVFLVNAKMRKNIL